jgi:hypothetical protein
MKNRMLLLCLFTVSFFLLGSNVNQQGAITYTVRGWNSNRIKIKNAPIRNGQVFYGGKQISFNAIGDSVKASYFIGHTEKGRIFTRKKRGSRVYIDSTSYFIPNEKEGN